MSVLQAVLFVALLFGLAVGVVLAGWGLLREGRSRWPWERRG